MDYSKILSRAWQITWNHKILWVFGILVALTSGGGGGSNFNNSSANNRGYDPDRLGDSFGGLPPSMQQFIDSPAFIATIIALICVLFIIGVVVFLLGVAATGALIGGIDLADRNGTVSFSEAWSIGTQNFLNILGLKFGFGVLNAIAAVISIICCPLLCIYIPAAIVLPLYLDFVYFDIVLEKNSFTDAMRKAFELMKSNVANVIVLGLILFGIRIAVSLVVALPMIAAIAPAFIAFTSNLRDPNMMLIGATGLAFVCLIPVSIVVSGIFTTWSTAAWQFAYRQFTGNAPAAPQLPSEPVVSPA